MKIAIQHINKTGQKLKAANRAARATGLGLILIFACNLQAQAAPQWCYGTLANLYIDAGGTVTVAPSWRGDYVTVCNVNQTNAAGVSPTTCMSWLSLMRSAVSRSAQTIIYYGDAPTCNVMPTYGTAPAPGYVMLNN